MAEKTPEKSRSGPKKPHKIHPNSLANLAKSPQPPRRGRPKGELNKVNRNLKTAVTEFVEGHADKLDALIDEIHAVYGAAAAWDRIVGLFEYRLPKLARTEHTGADGGAISVVQVAFHAVQADPDPGPSNGQVMDVDTVLVLSQLEPVRIETDHCSTAPEDKGSSGSISGLG